MEIKIKKESKKEMEFEVIYEKTILNPLKQKLLEYDEVEIAEWTIPHPLTANPGFYVRVRKGNVREIVQKAIDDIQKDLNDMLQQLEEHQ